jgi:Tfp pilus assembly protein PilO
MQLPIKRIFQEKRRLLIPALSGLALNLVLLAGVVYPLHLRVRTTEQRAQAAARELQAAERDEAAARGVAEGRSRTEAALKAFYKDVLPSNLAQARDVLLLHLAQLAEQHNLERSRRDFDQETDREGALTRMFISMSLQGDYDDIRQFIYQVESSTDFITIDSISLRQGSQPGAPLTLDLVLSTYYQSGPRGA